MTWPPSMFATGWRDIRHLARITFRLLDGGQKRRFWLVSVWAGLFSLLEMLVAAMVIPYVQCLGGQCSPVVADIAAPTGLGEIPFLTMLLFAMITLKLAVEAGLAWRTAGLAQEVQRSTVMRLLSAYMHLGWKTFHSRNRAHYYRRCASTAVEAAATCQQVMAIVSSSLVIALLTALMIWQNPPVALALIAGFALVNMVTQHLISAAQKRAALERENALHRWNTGMAEAFASFREIRTYGTEGLFLQHVSDATDRLATTNRSLSFLPALPRLVMDFGVLAVLLSVVTLWLNLGRPIGGLLPHLVFYAVVARTLLPAMMILGKNRAEARASSLNIELVLQELDEADRARVERIGVPVTPSDTSCFVLDNVCFRHERDAAPLLDRISATFPHPSWTAITGPSGAGKSTLLELLCGIHQPDSGEVRHAWVVRESAEAPHIALVPQHVALLDASIADNIVFGFDAGERARVEQALRLACLDDVVRDLPDGIDSPVGADGLSLSGGQRQRLAIARALYRKPDLLLIDEATSGLDRDTEARLFDNLRRWRPMMSVIAISHRTETLAVFDRRYDLQSGALREFSSHRL
ncbi:ABC transporter ATP-binding protein [Pseudazoarcus pumilus]|uniref:ABC transporter ATP-binding protein n=1 Tax=Pseudazoarcus pumilus TaxID=2067960 RepID=A0A2I6S8X0_9RHOO|nr:ABC transporter ATP-binding protein [Pseudazoarcus pumilus]AUN95703.1 hypothetical protein C0099_12640 [Pseudazoarcus pumilus]